MGAKIRKMFEIFQKKSSANAKFLIKNYWSLECLVLNFCHEKMTVIIEAKQDWKNLSIYWNLKAMSSRNFPADNKFIMLYVTNASGLRNNDNTSLEPFSLS